MSARADKNGRLFLDFRWRGNRVREYLGVPATRENARLADALAKQIAAEIRRGVFDYRRHFPNGAHVAVFHPETLAGTSVAEYLASWQARRVAETFHRDGRPREGASLHPTTVIHDAGSVRILSRELAGVALSRLSPRDCADLRTRLLSSRKAKTARNLIGILHAAMADAVRYGEIPANPVVLDRLRAATRTLPEPQPLSTDELARIVRALPDGIVTRDGATVSRGTLADLYSVWARTGWRSNEIIAVRRDWIDPARQAVTLRAARSPRAGGLEATPKTGQRVVDVGYDPEIIAAMLRGGAGYVFADSRGRPLSQEWLAKRAWNPTLKACGIPHRGQYALRDTFITLALSAGEDPGWVARVCGTSERMIWQHYRGYVANAMRRDGAAFARRMGSNMGSKPERGE